MEQISSSVIKKDHFSKVSGQAVYAADYSKDEVLFGQLLRSAKAKARILNISVPKLPEGYFVVDENDVPGVNRVSIVLDDTPVFAEEGVEYIGDPILMIVGPVEETVQEIITKIVVEYEELKPVLDLRESDEVFFEYNYGKGDIQKAFAEADKVYMEEFETGYQEQAYLETNGLIAKIQDDGKVTINGSMQCPYYLHGAVAKAMGATADKVQIIQDVTGGGFGGKEDYPSILACQAAVAAYKVKKPVRVIFGRREDMEFTSKRHPSLTKYRIAVKGNKVTAMDIDVIYNSGAYTTLSAVVLQRGLICASGVYDVPNLKVRGRAVKTNTVPCGAFRGFGAPQTFFAVETLMNHVAKDLGIEALELKKLNLVKQGNFTSTSGKYHFPVPLPEMIEKVSEVSDYLKKHKYYNRSQAGRYRRGIGMSMIFHGAGFTGSGERDHIKAVTKLHKYPDGRVEILASNSDIGQGIKTTFSKIVAKELEIPLDKVICENPDTDRVPDSGPTVASRSLMVVGELLRRAAVNLRLNWIPGEEQVVEEHYKEPDFMTSFNMDKFEGDAYPTYSWGVIVIEVEVDLLTAANTVIGAWASFDVGTPIDVNIVTGQMEGGLLQGIGYSSMEYMTADKKGRIRNNSYSDYLIPTSLDVPNLMVMLHAEKYPYGPYGAKGAGELPLVGAPGAYIEAMEQALDTDLNHIPFTAEDTMKVIMGEK